LGVGETVPAASAPRRAGRKLPGMVEWPRGGTVG
jgi:hypothetical protein